MELARALSSEALHDASQVSLEAMHCVEGHMRVERVRSDSHSLYTSAFGNSSNKQ